MIASIHVKRKYLSKENFKVSNKTICDLKIKPKAAKMVCRSWSRNRSSDLRLRGAGAKRNIYGSAILPNLLGLTII